MPGPTRTTRRAPRAAAKPAPPPAPELVDDDDADYDLAAVVEQRRDALGHDGDLVTFKHAGEVFSFPHPLFADDDWKDGLAQVRGDVAFGQYLLDDQYDRFRELGGRASHLAILVDQIRKDTQDADAAGRPTQSPISSRAQRRRRKRT